MDVGRLVLLAAVVEHGSITRASAALGFSQPALSRQVSALEREAQVRLLMRRPDGVTPTEAGRMLARRGEAIAAHATAARREIERLGLGQAGHLRIAAFPTAAATLGLDALITLRRSHPGVTVTIEERDRADALQALRRGHADLAVTFSTDPEPADDLLDAVALIEEEMLLALPTNDPRTNPPTRLADLHDESWIVGMTANGLIAQVCAAAGFTPRVAARLDHQPAIQAAVAAGVGVTLIPELAARMLHPGVTVHKLRAPTPVRHVAAHLLAGPRDPLVGAGLQALAAAAPHAQRRADGRGHERFGPT